MFTTNNFSWRVVSQVYDSISGAYFVYKSLVTYTTLHWLNNQYKLHKTFLTTEESKSNFSNSPFYIFILKQYQWNLRLYLLLYFRRLHSFLLNVLFLLFLFASTLADICIKH